MGATHPAAAHPDAPAVAAAHGALRRGDPVRRALARYPVTALLAVVSWLLAVATGSVLAGPPAPLRAAIGTSVDALHAGRWWTLLTAGGWCSGLSGYLLTTVVVLLLLPIAERRLGSPRTAALLVAAQVVGTGVGLALIGALGPDRGRWVRQLHHTVELGPGAAVVGTVLVASAGLGPLWRRRVRLVVVSGAAMLALYSGLLGDVLRLVAALLGLAAGMLTLGRDRDVRPRPASRSETRVLVALLVALSAVGPLVAALAQTRIGPLSVLRFVFTSPAPDPGIVAQLCADPSALGECAELQARARLSGLGAGLMSVMPVVLLLVAADGLRRGRRAAWAAALALNVGLGALGLVLAIRTASTVVEQQILLGAGVHVHALLVLGLPALQPLVVAAVLVAARQRFTQRAPAGTYRGATRTAAVTLVTVSVIFVAGSLLVRTGYDRPPGLAALLTNLPARFLPPGYFFELEPAFLPVSGAATVLFDWTGPVFWAVVCGLMLVSFTRSPAEAGEAERRRVRALLAVGGSSLSYMTTWAGHRYWFTPDGRAAVAYREIGGVALTTGGPVGDPAACADAVAGFVAYCREQGSTPCLYGVETSVRDVLTDRGWSAVQIAEETVLLLAGLAFTGRKWQDVRTALNKARRSGITAEWASFPDAPRAVTEQIRAISEEWSAEKGLPEMGFTLGGLAELDDPEVRLLLAVDAGRVVQAVTSWLPVRRDGRITGWTLDFMRRRTHGPNGVTEFLIASAAQAFRDEGAEFLSLSGAPLARLDDEQPAQGVQRLLDLLARRLEPVYGFRSLLAFKAKFQPEYRPLHLAYPDPVVLPAIGNALSRAYLPELSARELTRLLRAVLR